MSKLEVARRIKGRINTLLRENQKQYQHQKNTLNRPAMATSILTNNIKPLEEELAFIDAIVQAIESKEPEPQEPESVDSPDKEEGEEEVSAIRQITFHYSKEGKPKKVSATINTEKISLESAVSKALSQLFNGDTSNVVPVDMDGNRLLDWGGNSDITLIEE